MLYLATFLEGILTFISPCILPMLPIYFAYLAGDDEKDRIIINSIGFIIGFTIIFIMLGMAFTFVGSFFHPVALNYISGTLIIIFGLKYLNILKFNIPSPFKNLETDKSNMHFCKSIIFGMAFSLGWTACLTAFLSTAILSSAVTGSYLKGLSLLLTYSLGLGLPFFISALLINELSNVFDFIKKHYDIINKISGIFLIILGVLVFTGNLQ